MVFTKLGFENVTGGLAVAAKWSPGSTIDYSME